MVRQKHWAITGFLHKLTSTDPRIKAALVNFVASAPATVELNVTWGNQLQRGCTAFCPLSYGKTSKSRDTTPEIFHQVDESEKITHCIYYKLYENSTHLVKNTDLFCRPTLLFNFETHHVFWEPNPTFY